PEKIEEEQIEREEDADERSLQREEQGEKFLYAVVNGAPGDQDAERCKKCGQHYQPQRNAIEAEVVMNVRRGNPGDIHFELESGLAACEVRGEMQREHKREQRDEEREPANVAGAARQQQHQQSSRQRDEGNERENRPVEGGHQCTPSQTM